MTDKDTLDACLAGISYPADVDTIVDRSVRNACPDVVVAEMETMPNWTFDSPEELYCTLGHADSCHQYLD